ncbi:MAG TPA: winged helix-turn-helix domain-containing protein [Pyrinomonadaceae bacterium]|nr:winged helix-turn-helix domain-containing protein [Pyrinomonadaceae bacterium]
MNEPQIQIYEFGDFRIDAFKRLLTKGNNEPLPLTPKVFDTLLYLVRHHGKVIEKDELMREIWTDTIVEENSLSQNISTLRRVLGEKPGEGRFIATVPGHGFKFVPEVRETSEESAAPVSDFGEEESSKSQISNQKSETESRKPNRKRFAVFAALLILVLSSLGFYLWRGTNIKTVRTPVKSIAVLPFRPLVTENRDEALEIGMADTLISRLGSNREIVVRPLSAVRRFGNLEQDALAAGRALDVESVLDGSLQRWGDKLRVNVRLVKVDDGTLLWTETFDEKFTDIFVVQDAISNKVAAALALQLGSDEKMRLTKRYTENSEAYQFYLRGRFHVFKLTPPEIQAGIADFRQAIEIDPNYALAYAGLADAYRSLAVGSELSPTEFFPKSKAAANKAIEIDDALSDGHAALGMTLFWGEWDWKAAENQYRRALELNPNDVNAHLFYAHMLSNTGRHDEALAEVKIARELDPLFPFAGALEGLFLIHAGRTDEALDRLKKTLEIAPNFWMPHLFASIAYLEKGMYAEAISEARQAKQFSPAQTNSNAYESYALAKLGKREEAQAALDELLKLSTARFIPPCHIALAYNGLGETDKALEWLEKGYAQHDPKMAFLKVDPKWNNLRSEPRFIELMRRLNFE